MWDISQQLMPLPQTYQQSHHEVLTQPISIMNTLHLPYIVVVFDQTLYAKATDIPWKYKDRLQSVIPEM